MTGAWWSACAERFAGGEVAARRDALDHVLKGLRDGADADPALVAWAVDAMRDPDPYNAGMAANVLRTTAQYRRGDIAPAATALAASLTTIRSQELRKEAAEALVELAENGPGIPAEAIPLLQSATQHRMKHARQSATYALAADALARGDADALRALAFDHPRPDVRLRALVYVVRGAEWRDARVMVPLLLEAAGSSEPHMARAACKGLTAIVRGPPDAPHTEERSRVAAEVVAHLDALGVCALEPAAYEARSSAEHVARAFGRWQEAANVLAPWGDPPRRPPGWDATVEALKADVFDALVDVALHAQCWPVLSALMWHPSTATRVATLSRLSLVAMGSMRSMDPLVPALAVSLADPSPEVRRAAVWVVQTLAMFGGALSRTDLQPLTHALIAIAHGEGSAAVQAADVLRVGAMFGGVPRDALGGLDPDKVRRTSGDP